MMSEWSRDEDKAFEHAIAMHWIEKDSEENWDKISSMVPTKSLEEITLQFQILVDDVSAIEGGHIEVPNYDLDEPALSPRKEKRSSSCGFGFGVGHESGAGGREGGSRPEQERRKGINSLDGGRTQVIPARSRLVWERRLEEYIEELNRVKDADPSHEPAQKYFIRINSMIREWRRSSIHDITSIINSGDVAAATRPSLKPREQGHIPGKGMYSMPVGQPVVIPPGNLASAVGAPVMIPSPGHPPHPPYMVPVAYPMPPRPPMCQ